MNFKGPGIEHQPSDERLLRFGTLLPEPEKKPNPVVRLLTLPFRLLLRLIALPFKLIGRALSWPFRRGESSEDATAS